MKVLLTIALFFVATFAFSDFEYQSAFTFWMQKHGKSYGHDEFQHRYQTFKSNMNFIEKHNKANKTFTVAMNQFGDLTNKEFSKLYLGTKINVPKPNRPARVNTAARALPSSWDWRSKGAVTPIKNQQQCGSCWAFSTTGSVEGCHFLGKGSLVSLSEQNLMDCSTAQGNQGCDGGLMTQAMTYIIQNGGVDTEQSYPYTAEDGTCQYSPSNSGSTLGSYTNVNQGSESDLQMKVSQGPTSVAIDASQSSFQFYSGGVYSDPNCSTSQLDHGVLAIGWGTDSGQAFWLVKNSWGTDWGMNGFIEMARNDGNMCGIATMATLPQKC